MRITGLRVERLQEISEEDAEAEGVVCVGGSDVPLFGAGQHLHPSEAYAALWDEINGRRPGACWADSPWVWAISFELPVKLAVESRSA